MTILNRKGTAVQTFIVSNGTVAWGAVQTGHAVLSLANGKWRCHFRDSGAAYSAGQSQSCRWESEYLLPAYWLSNCVTDEIMLASKQSYPFESQLTHSDDFRGRVTHLNKGLKAKCCFICPVPLRCSQSGTGNIFLTLLRGHEKATCKTFSGSQCRFERHQSILGTLIEGYLLSQLTRRPERDWKAERTWPETLENPSPEEYFKDSLGVGRWLDRSQRPLVPEGRRQRPYQLLRWLCPGPKMKNWS